VVLERKYHEGGGQFSFPASRLSVKPPELRTEKREPVAAPKDLY